MNLTHDTKLRVSAFSPASGSLERPACEIAFGNNWFVWTLRLSYNGLVLGMFIQEVIEDELVLASR